MAAAGLVVGAAIPKAAAASLSAEQLQVIGRAAAFLQPPPSAGVVAVVYAPDDPASRQDARDIVAETDGNLPVAGNVLPVRAVTASELGGGGFALAIAAAGAGRASLGAAIRATHLLCATADLAAVQGGSCTMAVSTELRVQIVLNHAVAAACGINFVAAFRMMIHEI